MAFSIYFSEIKHGLVEFRSNHPDLLDKTCEKIKKILKIVLVNGIVLTSFVFNPTLFVLGAFHSLAAPDRAKTLIQRIQSIFNQYKWQALAYAAFFTFFAPHVTLGAFSCFTGALFGHHLVKWNQAESNTAATSNWIQ